VLLSLALWAGVVILLTALPARPDASPRMLLGRWVATGYAATGWLIPLLLVAADARARRRAGQGPHGPTPGRGRNPPPADGTP
jgi:hypothetical protein